MEQESDAMSTDTPSCKCLSTETPNASCAVAARNARVAATPVSHVDKRLPVANPFQEAVEDFHNATNQAAGLDTPEKRLLRAKLIMEEAVETVAALGYDVEAEFVGDLPEDIHFFHRPGHEFELLDFIDGLCDLTYVTMGGAVNLGIDIKRHFDEVHRCNMAKLRGPKREDGKQLKPEGWVGPDHQRILDLYHEH